MIAAESLIAALVPKLPSTKNTSSSSEQFEKVLVGLSEMPPSVATDSSVFHKNKVRPLIPNAACRPGESNSVKPG